MLTEQVTKELNQSQPTEFHERLLNHTRTLVDMSRQHMSTYYQKWDDAQAGYKAWQNLDKDDKKQILAGNPTKQKVPMIYAKIQTFKSFILSLYFQRPRFYELSPVGVEDEDYRELAESLLNNDLAINKWFNVLNKWSAHLAKFGIGVIKHSWDEDFAYLQIEENTPQPSFFGLTMSRPEVTTITKKIPKRMGNTISVVSPYHFLPDTRHPLSDFEKGEFCADECDMAYHRLMQLEDEGEVSGIKYVEALTNIRATWRKEYGAVKYSRINYNDPTRTRNTVRITEVQIKLIPSKFLLSDGNPLGSENFPIKFLLWIANDARIVKLTPMSYLHDCFTWDVAQYDEDDDTFSGLSLSELISPLQDTSDWFFNSRVENVSRNIEDKLVVDPVGVDVESIKNRGRIILLKKGASRAGVDKFVKQLDTRDVTARHMDDVAQVGMMINSVSGLSENLSGNYHTGRRSASESRVVTQGAAARPKLIAQSAWNSCLGPLGQKLLTNLRQGLPPELIVKYAGQQYAAEDMQQVLASFTSTPEELLSQCDMFVYEGTLESEKTYLAQQLMELFQQVIQLGPTGMINLEISPKLLLEKVYELLGVPNLEAFSITKDPQALQNAVQQIAQQMAMQMVEQMQGQQNGPPVQ